MSHIPYTILRNQTFYYNRRTPQNAVRLYGPSIRLKLGTDEAQAATLAQRLTEVLDRSFRSGHKIDLSSVTKAFEPKVKRLSEVASEYLELKQIAPKPIELAVQALCEVAGDRDISAYTRDDSKAFANLLQCRGNSSGTIRRRTNSICALLNYGFAELEIEKRNPFSRLIIKNEGQDRKKRGTFTKEQLQQGYEEALSSQSSIRLLMPILGETGCRLGEVVGLRVEDIDLDQEVIHIRPNPMRRLKTTGSERSLPLVGYGLEAMREALRQSGDGWLYPRYIHEDGCRATHASNALNKWLKARFDGLTAHSLRHTMRDRLREVEAPLELIDQIGGWSAVGGVGASYGQGYKLHNLHSWLSKVAMDYVLSPNRNQCLGYQAKPFR
ncbi:site-specific integrase [Pseudidiomarina sp.]|uniref:site-specific integrase n=1 Tax=Pseudidiomarina sp. TaxID=2081707 RepID=UPI003A97CE15